MLCPNPLALWDEARLHPTLACPRFLRVARRLDLAMHGQLGLQSASIAD